MASRLAQQAISAPLGTVRDLQPESVIFGRTEVMQALRQRVHKVADADVPVLIQGESGTGKEVLARFIHYRSIRQDEPFVKVNCPTIPSELFESEIFGYEQGAFTGATNQKPGWVENAHGGTLFLDEVAELPPSIQAKLLQLLHDGQFARLGGLEERKIEVRLISATNRSVEDEIEAGRFRKDLFYRINVVSIQLPPLRERRADIPELADYFLRMYAEQQHTEVEPLSTAVLQQLLRHDWPGNIRELENLIRRYVVLGAEPGVGVDLGKGQQSGLRRTVQTEGPMSLKRQTRGAVQELERQIILDALNANNWNRKDAARALDISYRALFYKIKQAGLPSKRILSGRGTPAGADDGNGKPRRGETR